MAVAITNIYRYPVKGLSAEPLGQIGLSAGKCLPHDRRFAIALGTTEFDPAHPQWLSKNHFIMLMRDETLAQLQTSFDTETGLLTIAQNGQTALRESLTTPDGARRIADYYKDFLGDPSKRPNCASSRRRATPSPMRGRSRTRRPTNTSR